MTTHALMELAERWQDEAAGTWGESKEHVTLQRCADELRAIVSGQVESLHRLPQPDGVEYPGNDFRTDAAALSTWATHMYDTGGTPYWGADAMHSLVARAKAEAATQLRTAASGVSDPGAEARDAVVRFNEDGSLDEVVGLGSFHLEQMGGCHWWMQLGPHMVNLKSKTKITAHFGKNEAGPDAALRAREG